VSRRTERIAEEIRAELSQLLREEVSDPRIGLVTLVRVDVAPDLSNARVFWSALDDRRDERLAEAGRGLASARGFLRKRLSSRLVAKRVPELRFEHDPSLAVGSEMLSLLAEIDAGAKGERAAEPRGEGTAEPEGEANDE
jgi:ribosome-binding factor A